MAKKRTLFLKGLTLSFFDETLMQQGTKAKCKAYVINVIKSEMKQTTLQQNVLDAVDAMLNDITFKQQNVPSVPKQEVID